MTKKPKCGNRLKCVFLCSGSRKKSHIFDAKLAIDINVIIGFRSIRRNFIHLEQILEFREKERVETRANHQSSISKTAKESKQNNIKREKNVIACDAISISDASIHLYSINFRLTWQPFPNQWTAFVCSHECIHCDLGCVHFFFLKEGRFLKFQNESYSYRIPWNKHP